MADFKCTPANEVEEEVIKPKIVIFGDMGVGKTWACLDFPNSYYADSEGSAKKEQYMEKLIKSGGHYFGVKDGASDFNEVIDQVKLLATRKHNFKTFVLDSYSKVYLNEIAKEIERLDTAKIKDEYGASKKPAVKLAKRLNMWLTRLDMTAILVCHETTKYEGGEANGVTFDGYVKTGYDLDLVLQITKEGGNRYARVVKTRLKSFPDGTRFPWSYEEFSKRCGRELIEKESVPIVLATKEQVDRINYLLETVRVEDDWLERIKTKAGVEKIDELDTEKASKVIESLEKKVGK